MLKLGRHTFADEQLIVMAIVNRTPDSFYDKGATYAEDAAMERVVQVAHEGAQLIDIGGVKAAPGGEVDVAEELRRTLGFVARVREQLPEIAISVDTYRSEVARELCRAGADVINDAWGGVDPGLVDVAAEFDASIVCTHTGGVAVRTRPFRIGYERDIVTDVIEGVTAYAERALAAGVTREGIIIDPAHDFGKNTWQSLEITRRLDELVATGWPVLVSLSNKDFIGETLDAPVGERVVGTLAASAISAWLGARIYRAHEVKETALVLDTVATIAGWRPPTRTVRGLA